MSAKKNFILVASIVCTACASNSVNAKAPAAPAKQSKKAVQATKLSPEDRALALVEQVKEVKTWEKEFGPKHFNPATQGRPGFEVEEHHGVVYVVNVFEDMPEHNVTFARYQVNVKTGSVKKVD
ncbi:MAG: hypothetical protein JST89_15255 [Cyanobacteria bacterium SZAS-4]|nr:hypothetical protein [Cyanobacteria bacterium SZAS-4]